MTYFQSHVNIWVWLQTSQGLRRFWSIFPVTRVPFWYRFLEPQPNIWTRKSTFKHIVLVKAEEDADVSHCGRELRQASAKQMRGASLGPSSFSRQTLKASLDCFSLVCGCGSMGSHFGVGAPPILVYFSGDWDVDWGYGMLTHGHVSQGSKA